MLYMVEAHYSPEQRDAALRYFQEHGLTHYADSLVVKGLWVVTEDHKAYVLVDAASSEEVSDACRPLEQFGEVQHHHVLASDEL